MFKKVKVSDEFYPAVGNSFKFKGMNIQLKRLVQQSKIEVSRFNYFDLLLYETNNARFPYFYVSIDANDNLRNGTVITTLSEGRQLLERIKNNLER